MTDKVDVAAGALAIALFTALLVVLMVPIYLLNGWALQWLWAWFVAPLGLPLLSMPHAIGLGVIVSFLTFHHTPKEGEKVKSGRALLMLFLRPPIAVAVGWVVQRFM